ncbi:MAG: Uma2 family endonuclease [Treponema sp.]|nr:Uma2 family endonuclease [Treponema sp.]
MRLFPEDDDKDSTVLRPDVFVVCDEEKLSDGRACSGAPDLVIEVVCEGSVKKDFVTKKALYEKAGVREYWVIDDEAVHKYVAKEGKYIESVHVPDAIMASDALPGCRVNFREILERLSRAKGGIDRQSAR